VISSGPDEEHGNVAGCSKAELYAGSPASDNTDMPQDNSPLKSAPALDWRQVAFDGTTMYTAIAEEVWAVDTSKPSPVETRIAGKTQTDSIAYGPGSCDAARIAAAFGIVVLGDHSLVVADRSGNGLLRLIDPQDPAKCKVVVHAGPVPDKTGVIDHSTRPNQGDVDGPGEKARFNGPEWPVAGPDGTIYFLDAGNLKVKKVAGDANRTVATVADLKGYDRVADWKGITILGNDLYLIGNGATESFVLKVPVTGGNGTMLVQKGGKFFPPLDETAIADLSGITNDGKSLLVSGSGYVWKIDPVGGKIDGPLAGSGIVPDYPPSKYDPGASQKPSTVVLQVHNADESKMGTTSFLTYHDGALYYVGDANSKYVEKISCP
jgi:hypothetical protein